MRVEYYRCWVGGEGDNGQWDTDYIDIPDDTPEHRINQAIKKAYFDEIALSGKDAPLFVGLYSMNNASGEDEEEVDERRNEGIEKCKARGTLTDRYPDGRCTYCGYK